MIDRLPPEVQQVVAGVIGLLPVAMLARLLWHHRLVRLGRRRMWGRELIWEVPTAVLSAIIGGGVAAHLGVVDPMAANAVVGVAAWMGPRGIETLFGRLVDGVAKSKTNGK